jgi:hypothetical protein
MVLDGHRNDGIGFVYMKDHLKAVVKGDLFIVNGEICILIGRCTGIQQDNGDSQQE